VFCSHLSQQQKESPEKAESLEVELESLEVAGLPHFYCEADPVGSGYIILRNKLLRLNSKNIIMDDFMVKIFLFCLLLVPVLYIGSLFVDNECEITGEVESLQVGDTLMIHFTDGRQFSLKEMPNCQIEKGSEVKMFCRRLPKLVCEQRIVVDSFAIIKLSPEVADRQIIRKDSD